MRSYYALIGLLLISASFAYDCTDSDGTNFTVKGTTTGVIDPTTGEVVTVNDVCVQDFAQEYYCGTEGPTLGLIMSTSSKCSYGCTNGACNINPVTGRFLREIINCTGDNASTIGINGFVRLNYDDGFTEQFNNTCGYSNGGFAYGLKEFYCSGNYYYSRIKRLCKCLNGACTEENIEILSDINPSVSIANNEASVIIPIQATTVNSITIKESLVEDKLTIISDNIEAVTNEKIKVTETGLLIANESVLLPNEAANAVTEIKVEVSAMELSVIEGLPEYDIEGSKQAYLLWFIPINLNTEVRVDARNGNVTEVSVNRPWWFIGSS